MSIMRLQDFLKEPFNYITEKKNKWLYIFNSVVFATIFLILFQPYGISEEMENPINPLLHKTLFFISIAFSTFFALVLSQFFLRELFGFQNVKIKKYVIWLLLEALLLLIINFGVSFIVPDLGNDFEQELNFLFQLKMYPKVLMILIFPFFGTIIYVAIIRLNTEIKVLGKQLSDYKYKNEETYKSEKLNIYNENDQIDLRLRFKDFLYVESSNQYIVIHYLLNNKPKKHIVRNRLKQFIAQSKTFPIKQCHRSYAVNLINVNHLTKLKGKEYLVILLDDSDFKIPVSNSYLDIIKKEFTN